MKTKPDLEFYDIKSTPEKETLTGFIRASFSTGVNEVQQWKKDKGVSDKAKWADFKDTYIEHLTRTEALGFHVQHGGHANAVNAASRKHGPSWRMIVSVEKDGPKAFATYPGGQSGNPGSVHYSSMLNYWSTGKYFNLLFLQKPEDAGNKVNFTTTLNPK